ncbi:hypothetical protein ACQKP8_16115 [Photobacterium alginatilyticum]|uniref:hypothetical protein n=1 Tax=Photobacterium alginatilyticum TaxID=1775171 RepID=UPI004068E85F
MTHKLLTLACLTLLSGCQSTHQKIIESNQSNAVDKEIIKQSINLDEYKSSGPCRTLLECAVYTNDIELAAWMLNKWDSEHTIAALVREYVYEEDGEHPKLRYIIDAPLRYNLSDEDAAKFLAVMTKHRMSTTQCGLGYHSPLAAAYLKDYPLSFDVILKHRIEYSRGKYKITDGYRCQNYPIDIKKETPREWFYEPSAFSFALEHYDGSPQKAQMLTLLLDESEDILPVISSGDSRCSKYTGSSALAFSICKDYTQAASFLMDYYRNTDRLTYKQKKEVFNTAKTLLANTPSATELERRESEKKRHAKEEWERFIAAQDARLQATKEEAERNSRIKQAAHKTSATSQISSIPSATGMSAIINSTSQTTPESVDHDFHLYVDEVGVQKESENTYFKGETCRRYPNSAACQPAAKPKPKPDSRPVDCWEEFTGTARPNATVCPE